MKPNFSYEEEAEEQFLNVSGQKALKQNSERFTQEVKEQGSWFCDFCCSRPCFPITRARTDVDTEEGIFSDRNY